VEVTLKDGRTVSHFTRHAPGTRENPMDTEAVNAKARLLMAPVLGAEKTEGLIRQINALEKLKDVRDLRKFLAGSTTGHKGRGGREGKALLRVAKDAKAAKDRHRKSRSQRKR
jgi:hypothetical protein